MHIASAICAYNLCDSGKVSKQQNTKLIFDIQADIPELGTTQLQLFLHISSSRVEISFHTEFKLLRPTWYTILVVNPALNMGLDLVRLGVKKIYSSAILSLIWLILAYMQNFGSLDLLELLLLWFQTYLKVGLGVSVIFRLHISSSLVLKRLYAS